MLDFPVALVADGAAEIRDKTAVLGIEYAPVDHVVLRDEEQDLLHGRELCGIRFAHLLHVLSEASLGERPVGDRETVLLARARELRSPPVAIEAWVSLEVKRLLGGFPSSG